MNIRPVENYGDQIAQAVQRDKVFRLESELLKMPQVDCPVRSFFADGIYAREVSIPSGVTATGAVHKHQHITVISKGRVLVDRPDGVVEFSAPATFISQPGVKNAVHAIEDTVWTTFHPNVDNENNLDVLVERYTTSKNQDLSVNRELARNAQNKLEQ